MPESVPESVPESTSIISLPLLLPPRTQLAITTICTWEVSVFFFFRRVWARKEIWSEWVPVARARSDLFGRHFFFFLLLLPLRLNNFKETSTYSYIIRGSLLSFTLLDRLGPVHISLSLSLSLSPSLPLSPRISTIITTDSVCSFCSIHQI